MYTWMTLGLRIGRESFYSYFKKFGYGEKFENGALILSNHEGTDSPMSLEIYCDKPIRMWGTAEMNSGLVKLYKYQTKYYYHEKKHWNIHLARLFCLLASPLTCLFYSGFDLISTYKDTRIIKTLRESIASLKSGDNIVIFPEDSTNGYLAQLEGFHAGFAMLCEYCKRKGYDVPIYVTYFKKDMNIYVIDKPVMYSELSAGEESKEEIAKKLCERCNELGRMELFIEPKPEDEIEVIEETEEVTEAVEKTAEEVKEEVNA